MRSGAPLNQPPFSSAPSELERGWFTATPQCATHPTRSAEQACARCGLFCCGGCLSQAWCDRCAVLVLEAHVPEAARAVAWKLLLAPLLFLGSSAWWLSRGLDVPPLSWAWLVPLGSAALVLRRGAPRAAWGGALWSLGLLAWQGLSLFAGGAELRLLDVALLAIGPAFALDGAARLGRLTARVEVLRSA